MHHEIFHGLSSLQSIPVNPITEFLADFREASVKWEIKEKKVIEYLNKEVTLKEIFKV